MPVLHFHHGLNTALDPTFTPPVTWGNLWKHVVPLCIVWFFLLHRKMQTSPEHSTPLMSALVQSQGLKSVYTGGDLALSCKSRCCKCALPVRLMTAQNSPHLLQILHSAQDANLPYVTPHHVQSHSVYVILPGSRRAAATGKITWKQMSNWSSQSQSYRPNWQCEHWHTLLHIVLNI